MSADGTPSNDFLPALPSPLADVMPHGYFAPVQESAVELLLAQYQVSAEQIARVAAGAEEFFAGTLDHFIEGNIEADSRRPFTAQVETLFSPAGAIKHLQAHYWSRALDLTDVYQHMPQNRRTEWDTSIRNRETPDFERKTVYLTLRELLHSRERFLAERVDGIFRSLSGTHVTNKPEGFSTRMIIAYLVDAYGYTNSDRCGYIHDLRCVISRFIGRDQPDWYQTSKLVTHARREHRGEWLTIDGGALRLRAYKAGTGHLEVHPQIAWRLNAILSMLHPSAIPSEFRVKPPRKARKITLFDNLVPFAVLSVIGAMKPAIERCDDRGRERYQDIPNTLKFEYGRLDDRQLAAAVDEVLTSIGGSLVPEGHYQFDYDPTRVIRDLLASGMLPNDKSHQFYPTPDELARRAVDLAVVGPHDTCLEPSAGNGALAVHLPVDRTTCVEVSAIRCRILRSRGLRVAERDFLDWSAEQQLAACQYDRIVMNPPFSENRAELHLAAARALLAPSGRLVAILPAGQINRPAPAGWTYQFSEPIERAFADTSIAVTLLLATRKPA